MNKIFTLIVLAFAIINEAQSASSAITERLGGFLERPDSLDGKICIVNCQKSVSITNLSSAVEVIKKNTKIRKLEVVEGSSVTPMTAADEVKKLNASAAIFLVDCDKCSTTMLIAPENRWAIINIAALRVDGAGQSYYDARSRKELVRTFLALTGAMDSTYKNSLMGYIGSPKELDNFTNENPPLDVVGRTRTYLAKLGVEARSPATYLQACNEGWAPAPTNDFQKAIWNRVHQPPKNPMKIEFDPKKGR